jgi:hypothetical protein
MRADDELLQSFCREVWSAAVAKSARIILETALGDVNDSRTLIDAVCEGIPKVGRTRVKLMPCLPIVAVGGPVRVYYDEVARRLGTEVIFAPYCDVANAVGAASALVANRVTVTVEGDGSGLFRLHAAGQGELLGSGPQALARATQLACEIATRQAALNGALNPRVDVTVTKNLMPDARDDEGLLTATVIAEAFGRPA